jgi:hypothetical protein
VACHAVEEVDGVAVVVMGSGADRDPGPDSGPLRTR